LLIANPANKLPAENGLQLRLRRGLSGQIFAKIDHHEPLPTVKTVKEAILAFIALAG